MGKRGPKPTPTAVLAARGSWRAKIRPKEPKPGRERPTMPAWLDQMAKRAWRRLVPQLDAMGVLTTADQEALAEWCQTYSKWRQSEAFVRKNGLTYADSNGVRRAYPETKLSIQLAEQLKRMGAEFGLTPSARAGLGVTAAFLTRGGGKAPPAAPDAKPPAAESPAPTDGKIIEGKDRFFK